MKKIKQILIIVVVFLSFGVHAYAASVYVSSPKNVTVNQKFFVDVYANTDGVSVNAFDAQLDYNENILKFSGYKDASSVIKLWVDAPHSVDGKILLSGIVPNGTNGVYDANKTSLGDMSLVRLIFTATGEGTSDLVFTENKLLKNDGFGTPLTHTTGSANVVVAMPTKTVETTPKNIEKTPEENVEKVPEKISPEISNEDKISPLPFQIYFVKSSTFSSTPNMIIFETSDAESGIKEYQMKEEDGEWVSAKSPAQVKMNLLARDVTVRAYDFSGNFTESSIEVPGLLSENLISLILLLIIIILLSVRKVTKFIKHKICGVRYKI